MGRDTRFQVIFTKSFSFQSTRPVWGATTKELLADPRPPDFNPRAPCGARLKLAAVVQASKKFQSTRPVWGATLLVSCNGIKSVFQSTRPVWGATSVYKGKTVFLRISIHAPRVGRDIRVPLDGWRGRDFNPRAPCGARHCVAVQRIFANKFQSTRPVWGATTTFSTLPTKPKNFNPRAPCGARHGITGEPFKICAFQSTRPVWGATVVMISGRAEIRISIHAPRVGRDALGVSRSLNSAHFNPRAPCGARLACHFKTALFQDFNPRAPCGARRANRGVTMSSPTHFNPRAPCGARRRQWAKNQ